MRAHLILSTLCAVGLFGGAALADRPDDHASKEKPTKEHFVREHVTREARTPERLDRARTHGDVERVSRAGASSHKVDRTSSEKARLQLESHMKAKFASRGNCSGVADECASHSQTRASAESSSSRTVGLSSPYSGWYAEQREKMREKALEAMMKSMAMKKLGLEGKL